MTKVLFCLLGLPAIFRAASAPFEITGQDRVVRVAAANYRIEIIKHGLKGIE